MKKAASFAFWGGMHTGTVSTSFFEDFENYDFRPSANSSLIGKGVPYAPTAHEAALGDAIDIGAYQRDAEEYWRPGCTFDPACATLLRFT